MKKLNEILGTEFPIIQGGMANIATGEFAAACSNAGALGVIATGHMKEAEMLRKEIRVCKSLTDKPFGVNIMLMSPNADDLARIVIEEGVQEDHVISDPLSADTRQNLQNAWAILQELGCSRPMVVTSDYHLPRALRLMQDMGMDAQGVGSPCRPGVKYFLKNHLREVLAWGKYWAVRYLGLKL